jgi:Replication protein
MEFAAPGPSLNGSSATERRSLRSLGAGADSRQEARRNPSRSACAPPGPREPPPALLPIRPLPVSAGVPAAYGGPVMAARADPVDQAAAVDPLPFSAAAGAQRTAARAEGRSRGGPADARPEGAVSRQHTKSASAPGQTPETARERRERLRRYLRRISPGKRHGQCGRKVGKGRAAVLRLAGGVARYVNVMVCGSIHCCPVCSAAKRTIRANEISKFATTWIESGAGLMLVTLTFPHRYGMRLDDLWTVLAEGFRYLKQGRKWQEFKDAIGLAGSIKATEVTVGWNGWHPHCHVLIFFTGDPAESLAAGSTYFRKWWARWITDDRKMGQLDPNHGVDVRICNTYADVAGAYIAKVQDGWDVGAEVARADAKQGGQEHWTPFEVLAEASKPDADPKFRRWWREWEESSPGRHTLDWSPRLRQLAGLPPQEDDPDLWLPDEDELAEAEAAVDAAEGQADEGEDIAVIPERLWSHIYADDGLHKAVRVACETAGLAGVNAELAAAGLPPVLPWSPEWRQRLRESHPPP